MAVDKGARLAGRLAGLGLALLFGVALLASGASAAPSAASRLGVAAARRAYAAARAAASGGAIMSVELLMSPLSAHASASAEQLESCTEEWFSTEIDHFSWRALIRGGSKGSCHSSCLPTRPVVCRGRRGPLRPLPAFRVPPGGLDMSTFPLRYFLCSTYWRKTPDGSPGPILFYAGNVRAR